MGIKSNEETFAGRYINRYKLHFYLFWIVLFAAQTYKSTVAQPLRPVVLANLAELSVSAAFACTVLYLLLPRFGRKGKKKLFVILTVLLLLAAAFVSSYFVYLIVLSVGVSPERANWWPRIPGETIYTFLVASSFGFVKIADDYFREKTRTEELKKDKIRAELDVLKAQINPHFLFNTLNNLYFMVEKDPNRAAKMILKLSDILRYQIYETGSDKTSVEKEIDNIKNYIELEKIRKDNIDIEFNVKVDPVSKEVLPNIFLPLVENAFKHLTISDSGVCRVNISIVSLSGSLLFTVMNTSSNNGTALLTNGVKSSGIGIMNLKRRLDLFYPGKYELKINNQKGSEIYEVKLKLYAD